MNKNCLLVLLSITVLLTLSGMVALKALFVAAGIVGLILNLCDAGLAYLGDPIVNNSMVLSTIRAVSFTILLVVVCMI